MGKSFAGWNKVEYPTVVPTSCELADDEQVKIVLSNNEKKYLIQHS